MSPRSFVRSTSPEGPDKKPLVPKDTEPRAAPAPPRYLPNFFAGISPSQVLGGRHAGPRHRGRIVDDYFGTQRVGGAYDCYWGFVRHLPEPHPSTCAPLQDAARGRPVGRPGKVRLDPAKTHTLVVHGVLAFVTTDPIRCAAPTWTPPMPISIGVPPGHAVRRDRAVPRPGRRRLAALGVGLQLGRSRPAVGCISLTALGVTVGFHRLFTHRSFETNAVVKFIFAVARLDGRAGAGAEVGRDAPPAPPAQRRARRPAFAAPPRRGAGGVLRRVLARPRRLDLRRRPGRPGPLRQRPPPDRVLCARSARCSRMLWSPPVCSSRRCWAG